MNRFLKIAIFGVLILAPVVFYKNTHPKPAASGKNMRATPLLPASEPVPVKPPEPSIPAKKESKPKIAIILDDFGENLNDIKEAYALGIPLSIAIVPGLKFSKNIAQIAVGCGFSVLIHMPMAPKNEERYRTHKYQFVSASLGRRTLRSLLRHYLNSIKVAVGVNNHMGSAATENAELMAEVMRELKKRKLFFIDSRTSLSSVAYDEAKKAGLPCAYSVGFLDSVNSVNAIGDKIDTFVDKAAARGKIIIIGHPKKNTFSALRNKLPALKKKIEFITVEEYLAD